LNEFYNCTIGLVEKLWKLTEQCCTVTHCSSKL